MQNYRSSEYNWSKLRIENKHNPLHDVWYREGNAFSYVGYSSYVMGVYNDFNNMIKRINDALVD